MVSRKESNQRQQEVRLSYDNDKNSFILGGNQDEVQKILSDLSNISKLQSPLTCATAFPLKHDNVGRQHLSESGSRSMNNGPPMPSPQPTRPNCPSPNPSMHESNCGYSIDFDQLISTPS